MNISELEVNQKNVEIAAEVAELGEVREFEKFGRQGRVCTATIKDDSGEVKLTLWDEQIDKVKEGDKIEIKNGYVKEWQGEKQLSVGRFGSLEVI
ncbi:DNA-binding protein [Candidatus Woesearchaeota archaeon]|nr:DNA-binding protein [Candidatus Woesearchaeota archaeon]